MKRTVDQYFTDYASYHQDHRNKLTHYGGIPLIVIAVLGLLARITFGEAVEGFRLDGGVVAWILASFWYIRLDLRLGASFALVLAGLYWVGRVLPVPALIAAFVVGWILQLWGHHSFEKKAPAFTKNFEHLLIGPFWIFAGFFRK